MIDLTKEVLRLEAEGLSRSQIAARLGMSRGSVSARIHRARNPRPKGERRPRIGAELLREHGHRAGDLVLRRAAQAMRKAMRADSLLARYGGEEFCAIVPVDDEDDATRAAERIRAMLSRLALSIDHRPLRLSVSIGLAVQRGDLRFDELLAIADEGVYLAKERGRDCVIAPGSSPEINRPARPRAAPRVWPA